MKIKMQLEIELDVDGPPNETAMHVALADVFDKLSVDFLSVEPSPMHCITMVPRGLMSYHIDIKP